MAMQTYHPRDPQAFPSSPRPLDSHWWPSIPAKSCKKGWKRLVIHIPSSIHQQHLKLLWLPTNTLEHVCPIPLPKSKPLSQVLGRWKFELFCYTNRCKHVYCLPYTWIFWICKGTNVTHLKDLWSKYHQYPFNATEPWRGLSNILSYSSALGSNEHVLAVALCYSFSFPLEYIGIHWNTLQCNCVPLDTRSLSSTRKPQQYPPALVHPPAHPTQVQMLSSTHLMPKKTKIHNSAMEFLLKDYVVHFPQKTNEGDNGTFQM